MWHESVLLRQKYTLTSELRSNRPLLCMKGFTNLFGRGLWLSPTFRPTKVASLPSWTSVSSGSSCVQAETFVRFSNYCSCGQVKGFFFSLEAVAGTLFCYHEGKIHYRYSFIFKSSSVVLKIECLSGLPDDVSGCWQWIERFEKHMPEARCWILALVDTSPSVYPVFSPKTWKKMVSLFGRARTACFAYNALPNIFDKICVLNSDPGRYTAANQCLKVFWLQNSAAHDCKGKIFAPFA